jgi:hypothetical protein
MLVADKDERRLYALLGAEPTDRTDELIAEPRDRVRSLEDQLDQEREANRENRRIIAALTSRIPELEAPAESAPDAPGSPPRRPGASVLEKPFYQRGEGAGGRTAPVLVA